MSTRRKSERGVARFNRRAGTRRPQKSILIVTEGEKTEPLYLAALKKRLGLRVPKVDVVVEPGCADPRTLTERAIELKNKRMRDAEGSNILIQFDEVWVVFDLESKFHPFREKAQQARQIGEPKGIRFAVSDPAFEYWLLLHDECTHAPLEDGAAVIKRLKKHIPNYVKKFDPPPAFLEKTPVAFTNAGLCRRHHEECHGDGNPSTGVDKLVHSLNQNANDDVKFNL